ncbi:P-loop containing nucleoside triphosphate hydrolase protein [Roridomyces roridus]|uniref:P-loop containing nucleoside triphosphate hydrolase protein n=1 Tax=Roridomyces roridus TaxID=1738132 RepID=A0AAD7F9E8_9AGAR|nr:P-loop containing nucleoside triphosphate hydrolase protein [Roridomyces roridus]
MQKDEHAVCPENEQDTQLSVKDVDHDDRDEYRPEIPPPRVVQPSKRPGASPISGPIFYKRFDINNRPPPPPPSPTRLPVESSAQKRQREEQDGDEQEKQRKAKKDDHTIENVDVAIAFADDGGTSDDAEGEDDEEYQPEFPVTRAGLDLKRRCWLYENRALFEPLLPHHKKSFFPALIKEMETKASPSLPMHNFVEQPKLIVGGEMKSYQLAGLSFLAHMYHNGISCILGDEMGLGKTLQTLSLFAHIKETCEGPLTHLIVCPLSVLSSWESECARWVPSMRLQRFHGSPDERTRIKNVMKDSHTDILLTTYETLSSSDQGWLKTRRYASVILDEGHRIKNADTEVSQRAAGLGGAWRAILTGTPVQNNLTELWGLLHWLYPYAFTNTSRTLFSESFDLASGSYAMPVLDAVRALLAKIQLRRTKAGLADTGALASVPAREEWTVFIPLTEAQRFWTYRMLTHLDTLDLEALFPREKEDVEMDDGRKEVLKRLRTHAAGAAKDQWKRFSMLLMQLRRICDHPYMIEDAEPEDYDIGEHIVAASSKMLMIDKILADALPKGERVLIFSQWTDMLDLLEDHMALRDINYLRLDGSVSRARRSMVIRMFQREDSEHQVFLISTKAGGLGINLTKASVCIMCDSDWNPQNDLQAIARAHRIGQTKVVKVYRLICRASVEDQMLDRIRRKLFLSAKIIGGEGSASDGDSAAGLGSSELMSILRRGSSALAQTDDGMDLARFRTAPLQEILDVSRTRADVHDARVKRDLNMEVGVDAKDGEALLKGVEEEEKEMLSGVARVQSYLFEGTILTRVKAPRDDNKHLAPAHEKRERVDRLVTEGGLSFILDESLIKSIDKEQKPAPKKVKKQSFEWEDNCIECEDGGEVVICNTCPRVFHAECHPTLDAAYIQRAPMVVCGQHSCWTCTRNTAAAGGLLLRCQSCPRAFCSDCVSWDDIKMIGDTIPQFVLLKYGKKDSTFFIRCAHCIERGKDDPEWLKAQEVATTDAQKLVDAMPR